MATQNTNRLLKLIRDLADRLERVAPDADGNLDSFDMRLLNRADNAVRSTGTLRASRSRWKKSALRS